MKINIMTVKYSKDPNIQDKCTWFTWKETYDNCGNIISEFNDLITNMYHDTEEKDYCLNCMRKYIDDRIVSENNV